MSTTRRLILRWSNSDPRLRVGFYLNPYFEKRGMSLKFVGKVLALLAFCVSGTTFAQTAPASCTPYSIPVQSTVTECGPGLTGSKYKTMTKTCPGGEVKESAGYDTSSCRTATTGSNGAMTYEARCRLTPGGCANAPIAQNCPAGRKWTLMGSGIAHCVDVDPSCPWGTSLTHDRLGNPSCVQNTCPSNQVLQADGKACGCPTNTGWNGSSCVPPSCFAGTATTSSSACTYGGIQYYRETTSCPSGTYGAPSKSGYWDQSACAPRPITCTASSYTESAACGSGRNGSMYREVYTNCPGGQYGSPSTSYGGWNEGSCTAACSPSQSTYATACGTGYSGTKYITTNYTCPSGSYQTENTSQCGCANGANNYPTCTPPYQEPVSPPAQPAGCYDSYGGMQPVGTSVSECYIPGGSNPYPRGRKYKCDASGGWALTNPGSGTVRVYCE